MAAILSGDEFCRQFYRLIHQYSNEARHMKPLIKSFHHKLASQESQSKTAKGGVRGRATQSATKRLPPMIDPHTQERRLQSVHSQAQ